MNEQIKKYSKRKEEKIGNKTIETRPKKLERAKGFEPSTPTLARLYSTTELHPLILATYLIRLICLSNNMPNEYIFNKLDDRRQSYQF